MINLLSIRCTLAFAPYLKECLYDFDQSGNTRAILVQQGGSGLILRSETELVIRHQGNEVKLDRESARHFLATIGYRATYYDVARMSNEIVMANAPSHIYVSFPQSECWLRGEEVDGLLSLVDSSNDAGFHAALPEWLVASWSGTTLLLSDQRNGRWVLLSREHLEELLRRRGRLGACGEFLASGAEKAPRLQVKGVELPPQVAFEVADAFDRFSSANESRPFEERSPLYSVSVHPSSEGLELRSSDRRVTFNKREAAKWTTIIREELKGLNAIRLQRGRIRTVIANGNDGKWVLQCGDEVLMTSEYLSVSREEEWLIALDPQTGGCAALTKQEAVAAGC